MGHPWGRKSSEREVKWTPLGITVLVSLQPSIVVCVNYLLQSAFSSVFRWVTSKFQAAKWPSCSKEQGCFPESCEITWFVTRITQTLFLRVIFHSSCLPDNINSDKCVELCSANLEKMRKAVLLSNKNLLTEIWLHWVPYYTVKASGWSYISFLKSEISKCMWFEHPPVIHWTGWNNYLTTTKTWYVYFKCFLGWEIIPGGFLFPLSEEISDQLMKNRACGRQRRNNHSQLLPAPGLMKGPVSEWRDVLSPSYRLWWIPYHLTLHPLSPKRWIRLRLRRGQDKLLFLIVLYSQVIKFKNVSKIPIHQFWPSNEQEWEVLHCQFSQK